MIDFPKRNRIDFFIKCKKNTEKAKIMGSEKVIQLFRCCFAFFAALSLFGSLFIRLFSLFFPLFS